ncbi:MAG: putative baseplate assembly protein [Mucilaginibacter sp.]|nr:putative baseplate assembly protein [Mucilaginibacter sp.]
MTYFCCDKQRRTAVLAHPLLNGIDYIEVVDNPADAFEDRQTTLLVYFLKDLDAGSITLKNILIKGGERITNITITSVYIGLPGSPLSPIASPVLSPPEGNNNVLVVKVASAGDFSTYTLSVVIDADHTDPPSGFDPVLSSVDFSFKVLCKGDFDCSPQCGCTTESDTSPDINYLAKDYASFKQLMIDRMALLYPQWRERNAADPGVMLVELLAYTGDYLSYRQDAIATEAYLGTARKRISVRRHARLVDYYMNDGCNARTWAHLEVAEGITGLPLVRNIGGNIIKLLTKSNKLPNVLQAISKAFTNAINEGVQVFEMLQPDIVLDARNNMMHFYTWAEKNCCLPAGATSATLDTHLLALQTDQVLIFQEVLGPRTGKPGDANPKHRQAVKLKNVELAYDPIGNPNGSPPDYDPKPITKIEWYASDALLFPLWITSTDDNGIDVVVSVALGNNILVDYGCTQPAEILPAIPDATGKQNLYTTMPSCDPCKTAKDTPVPIRYNPALHKQPLTQVAPYNAASAIAAMKWDIKSVLPSVKLTEIGGGSEWKPLRDLISSNSNDKNFVTEVESDGVAWLRFGNDVQGKMPTSDITLSATYRVGNGTAGNIGAQTLKHLVTNDAAITNDTIVAITNPLPATGGIDPESIEMVRKRAPIVFRTQERAVTMPDYEDVATRTVTNIQRSAATLRWTGSWRTVFLTVDRLGGTTVDSDFENTLRGNMEQYRMAGQDLEVESPQFVSLEIEMTVCVQPDYFKSEVNIALLNVLSNRKLPDGTLGIFHPDNFSFGEPVYLSSIYTAAQKVAGINSVTITKFQRQGKNGSEALNAGKLVIGRTEIARLDNDPNFREHGIFNLNMEGEK